MNMDQLASKRHMMDVRSPRRSAKGVDDVERQIGRYEAYLEKARPCLELPGVAEVVTMAESALAGLRAAVPRLEGHDAELEALAASIADDQQALAQAELDVAKGTLDPQEAIDRVNARVIAQARLTYHASHERKLTAEYNVATTVVNATNKFFIDSARADRATAGLLQAYNNESAMALAKDAAAQGEACGSLIELGMWSVAEHALLASYDEDDRRRPAEGLIALYDLRRAAAIGKLRRRDALAAGSMKGNS